MGDIKISKQTVQLTGSPLSDLHGMFADGILGFGPGHVNFGQPTTLKTPLKSIIDQNLLFEKLFTINLDDDSFISFGFIDEAARAGKNVH
jgi:hypothetical protein